MDEQINQLDKRLTAVEKDVSMLRAQAAVDNKLSSQIVAVDNKLSAQIAAVESKLSSQIADLDSKLSSQIADLDRKLSVQIAALESKIFQMESRYIRWTVGTVVTVAGVVLAIVRTFP